ncbi:MAG: hypothetical protein E6G68_09015 [Actinobacteria bacterium]|nr:MAG: hypothetical protein E6G68_09015 [Actinomycetota bacterium]
MAAGLGLLPAMVARSKGREPVMWWLFGFVVFPVALVAAFIIEEERPCPSCGGKAKVSAVFCPMCGRELPRRPMTQPVPIDVESTIGMTPMQREELRRRAERERH